MIFVKYEKDISINIFRKTFLKKKDVSKQPPYFACGKRYTNIMYAK